MRCDAVESALLDELLKRYGLTSVTVANDEKIPGSYWGAPEAGLRGECLYWRADTPVHSLLHELAHYVCMDATRRSGLETDAGSDDDEECAVCYLEVLLAGQISCVGIERCLADMDAWGYSFRQGSARAWFAGDGRDARAWLLSHRVIRPDDSPTWHLRK